MTVEMQIRLFFLAAVLVIAYVGWAGAEDSYPRKQPKTDAER